MNAEPINSPPPKRKRFWYQFSLRTLLIVVTLLGAAFGYVASQDQIIRKREALANEVWRESPRGLVYGVQWIPSMDGIPWVRRWLGDKRYDLVILRDATASDDVMERYRQAFPEAKVVKLSEAKKHPEPNWPPFVE